MTYGGSVPAVTASYSGFVNGDTASSLTTQAHVLDHGHIGEPGRAATRRRARVRPTPNYTITYVAARWRSARRR